MKEEGGQSVVFLQPNVSNQTAFSHLPPHPPHSHLRRSQGVGLVWDYHIHDTGLAVLVIFIATARTFATHMM